MEPDRVWFWRAIGTHGRQPDDKLFLQSLQDMWVDLDVWFIHGSPQVCRWRAVKLVLSRPPNELRIDVAVIVHAEARINAPPHQSLFDILQINHGIRCWQEPHFLYHFINFNQHF
jgi:hypothetical protein